MKLIDKIMANKKIIVISMFTIGILFVAISSFTLKEKTVVNDDFDQNEYVSNLEKKVEALVNEIQGTSDCNVMISVISTVESVYVKENKKKYDNDEQGSKSEMQDSIIKMTDSNGKEYALVTKQIMPTIGGVSVVCKNGNDSNVVGKVTRAVSTVLGIGSNKVCVIAKAN